MLTTEHSAYVIIMVQVLYLLRWLSMEYHMFYLPDGGLEETSRGDNVVVIGLRTTHSTYKTKYD